MSDVKRYGVFDLLHLTLLGDERFVYASDYDAIQADRDRLAAELHEARNERRREHELRCRLAGELEAVRELMNSYNLGGWTDAVAPMQRALKAEAELSAARSDAERIDWIDAINERFQMSWRIGKAPAGNLSVQSVISLGGKLKPPTLRETIDAARATDSANPVQQGE